MIRTPGYTGWSWGCYLLLPRFNYINITLSFITTTTSPDITVLLTRTGPSVSDSSQEAMMEHSNFSLELSGIMYWIDGDSAIWEIVNSFAGENPHDPNHLNVVPSNWSEEAPNSPARLNPISFMKNSPTLGAAYRTEFWRDSAVNLSQDCEFCQFDLG